MFCRIMGYDLKFKYVKGKYLLLADALSRSSTMNQNRSKVKKEIETTRLLTEDPRVTSSLSERAEETIKYDVLQSVIHRISESWKTHKRHIPFQILPFWSVKDELSFSYGIVTRVPCTSNWLLNCTKHTWVYSQLLDVLEHPCGGEGWTFNWNSS